MYRHGLEITEHGTGVSMGPMGQVALDFWGMIEFLEWLGNGQYVLGICVKVHLGERECDWPASPNPPQ